jgi:nucleotide-binding universal stress UspA family protein
MKKILVPTDFSAQAENALNVAASLADRLDARLQLLHVIEPVDSVTLAELATYAPAVNAEYLYDYQLATEAQQRLNTLVQKLNLPDRVTKAEVKTGKIIRHILETVKADEVDLIVMGTKGASGLYEMLIGSNAEKVVRMAECPVLTIPEKTSRLDLRNVVMAVDFDEECSAFIRIIRQWQQRFGFALHLLFVNSPLNFSTTAQIEAKLESFLQEYPLPEHTFTVIHEYAFEDGIRYFADKQNADLIAMATHGRRGIDRILDGSVTERVVNRTVRPVLSCNLKGRK